MAYLVVKKVKGIDYWTLVESKRINGKPRQVILEYIGNKAKLSEFLCKALEAMKLSGLEHVSLKSYQHGASYALMQMAGAIGLEDMLDKNMPDRSRDGVKRSTSLILAAIHRAISPGSKNAFQDWFRTTTLPHSLNINPKVMTSQHFWDQMDDISELELRQTEDRISGYLLERYRVPLDKIALDYTNYFTYIASDNKKSTIAKRGRNKQKRHDLRQCSLAIITTKDFGIPLFSHVYEGNCNDLTEFPVYVKLLKERIPSYDPRKITLVFDGGSNTKDNLDKLETHYICAFSLSYSKELYDIDKTEYEEITFENKTETVYRTRRTVWGKQREFILMLSASLLKGQLAELDKDILGACEKLSDLNARILNPRSRIRREADGVQKQIDGILKRSHLKEVIRVSVHPNGIVYYIDEEKKADIANRYFGKKLIMTDHAEWTTREILTAYNEQDCIEKIFRDTKDTEHFSMRPLYHWTDQKIRVHIFICLLGLTLTTLLKMELEACGNKHSKDKILDILSGVRECWVNTGLDGKNSVIRKIEEMDAEQSDMMALISSLRS